MYIIEDADHKMVGQPLNNLSKVLRPDGGWTTNAKVDEQLYDEGGDEYFIREVIEERTGAGDMLSEVVDPAYADGKWKRITKYVERPEPVDAQGTDEEGDGYDPHYARNLSSYRRIAYQSDGVSIDEMIVALWEKLIEDRGDSATALQVKREAIKKRFPKPE